MKTTFLQQNNSESLLLFFHGWGMDPGFFRNWTYAESDVLVVWDYRQLTALPALSQYREIRLLAWSLGVWVAAVTRLPQLRCATAINGTLKPVDRVYGIQPEIFQGTIDNWLDEKARERFQQRVTGPVASPGRCPNSAEGMSRQPADQQEELVALQYHISRRPAAGNIYNRALISGRDRIFPPVIQRRFWEKECVPCTEWPGASHFPFAEIRSWQELWHLE